MCVSLNQHASVHCLSVSSILASHKSLLSGEDELARAPSNPDHRWLRNHIHEEWRDRLPVVTECWLELSVLAGECGLLLAGM